MYSSLGRSSAPTSGCPQMSIALCIGLKALADPVQHIHCGPHPAGVWMVLRSRASNVTRRYSLTANSPYVWPVQSSSSTMVPDL